MKKLFSIMAIAALVFAGTLNANASVAPQMPTASQTLVTAATVTFIQDDGAAAATEELGWHQTLKKYFIEGTPLFMGIVLLCLILGLAIAIERIIYLNLSTTNTQK
jgi:biopolymer transport protein ExbB